MFLKLHCFSWNSLKSREMASIEKRGRIKPHCFTAGKGNHYGLRIKPTLFIGWALLGTWFCKYSCTETQPQHCFILCLWLCGTTVAELKSGKSLKYHLVLKTVKSLPSPVVSHQVCSLQGAMFHYIWPPAISVSEIVLFWCHRKVKTWLFSHSLFYPWIICAPKTL